MRRVILVLPLAVLALCALAAPAGAALKISSATRGETLAIDAQGRALISWSSGSTKRHAVVTGSTIRYAGSLSSTAKAVRVTPTVPFALVQYQLPNGQQFALQRLQRVGQYGKLGAQELYLARWSGDPTSLTLTGEGNRICGTATYHGTPFYGGPHTLTGNPLDALGRNVYLDTLRSTGWYRMLGVLTRPLGWAYLVPADLVGTRYRALVVGPNVDGDLAPVASVEVAAPPPAPAGICPFPPGTYAGA